MKITGLVKSCVTGVFVTAVVVLIQSCGQVSTSDRGVSYNAPAFEGVASAPLSPKLKSQESFRPGLATAQGRSIYSSVNQVPFERSSGTKPKSVSMIYYNDNEGVDAMTRKHFKYRGSGMEESKDGLVEWGIRSGFRYAPNYRSEGKRFVIGKKGKEYAMVIKNKCHSRLEVVLSVDGMNILSGKKASVKQRGYIIKPGKTLVVKGFRTGQNEVRAFKFSNVAGSLANQLQGTTQNVGVVGMAVFTEKNISPWRWTPTVVANRYEAKPF